MELCLPGVLSSMDHYLAQSKAPVAEAMLTGNRQPININIGNNETT